MEKKRWGIYTQGMFLLDMIIKDSLFQMYENGHLQENYYRKAWELEQLAKQHISHFLPSHKEGLPMIEAEKLELAMLEKEGVCVYYAEKYLDICERLTNETAPLGNSNRVVYHEMMREIHENMQDEAKRILYYMT
ncbi:hypothetical protein SAMN02745116_00824 [Pilibacter termitis]|uniref:Uncharacterized protein n=1 Tax=Pilibacter termitis TaxID=263852 RepID=A0A1T4LW88_9ENTE|nr:hypothetical protein [Pilibacter termitis]SJZ58714.1 hypothetical protein SAMN02745116_00824 [Pilibacter termitis]